MTTTEIQDKNISRFMALFGQFEAGLNGSKDLPQHGIRQAAAKRLEDLQFPTRRTEDWKYTSVTRIVTPDYQLNPSAQLDATTVDKFSIPELDAHKLVFVNGQFNKELSDLKEMPEGFTLVTIAEALENATTKALVDELLAEATAETDDPFVAMNGALAKEGHFVHVAKNTVVERPLHLLYINTAEETPFIYNPQLLVVAEQSSQLEMVESFHSTALDAAEYFCNIFTRFLVKENAYVRHYKLQNESRKAFQINNTLAYQKKDSTYTNYTLDLGGRIVRNNLSAIHQGENVTSNMYGAFLCKGEQHVDNSTFIDHAIPHCQSNELYKGILTDKARGVFNGKVMVRKDAQKTNAFQQNSSLVLSDTAVMDSKPQLEIFADDVKCSHGATIGQLEESAVFYLRSRGMTEAQARASLQYAFLLEVLDSLPNEVVKAVAEKMIYAKFDESFA